MKEKFSKYPLRKLKFLLGIGACFVFFLSPQESQGAIQGEIKSSSVKAVIGTTLKNREEFLKKTGKRWQEVSLIEQEKFLENLSRDSSVEKSSNIKTHNTKRQITKNKNNSKRTLRHRCLRDRLSEMKDRFNNQRLTISSRSFQRRISFARGINIPRRSFNRNRIDLSRRTDFSRRINLESKSFSQRNSFRGGVNFRRIIPGSRRNFVSRSQLAHLNHCLF